MDCNITDLVTSFYMHGWVFQGLEIKKSDWNEIKTGICDGNGLIHIAVKILDLDNIIIKTNWDECYMKTNSENIHFALEELNRRVEIMLIKKREAIKKLDDIKSDFEE